MLVKKLSKKDKNYSFVMQKKVNCLDFSMFRNKREYYSVFQILFYLFPKADSLVVWNSELTEHFFVLLKVLRFPVRQLLLRNCSIGPQIVKFISKIDL